MMIWNPEANVKLLVGILAQLRDQSVRLDYKKLAEHMGPECNAKSVMNQFTKLKKQAAEAAEGTGEHGADDETPAVAKGAATKKRKAVGASGKGPSAKKKNKKAKTVVEADEDDEEMASE